MDDLGSNLGTWELPVGFNPASRASQLVEVGVKYHLEGNTDAARMHYDAALLLEPDHPLALSNLSGILFNANQDHASLSVAARAVRESPNDVYAKANHGAALLHLGKFAQAKQELEAVLRTYPSDPGIWHNLALAYYMSGDIERGIKAMNRSIEGGPASKDRLSDLGIFTLATGDFQAGLAAYEVRWETLYKSRAWNIGVPEWKGEDLRGKNLLLHHEQGFGDGIMLCRFIRDLQERECEVTIASPPGLIRLFGDNFCGTAVVEWNEDFGSNFDFHSPMLSVPRWLGLQPKDINPKPYLAVEPWAEKLGAIGTRIGLCWESGDHSPAMTRRRRVVPLEKFFPLSELPGVRLVSLQHGSAQKDILSLGAESFIFDPMSKVEDFYDTASIISCLDLVISVDSAVAHLSGALGKPCLMLGPYTRCWRWWGETTGLPWYENFKIFKQESYGDWNAALKAMYKEVEGRIK